MYYVYILKSIKNSQIYTGYPADLQKRIKEHNSSKSIHSNKFHPWYLQTYVAFENQEQAT